MRNRLYTNCAVLLVALALLPGVLAHAQTGPASAVATTAPRTPVELSERLTAVIQSSLPGWTLTRAPQACDRDCLARDLPQDAPLTSTYNFSWSLALQLVPPEPREPIEARVFCMGEDLEAFGLFAHHRDEKTIPATIATQSFWTGNAFHIWRGAFYIRLVPASADKLLRASVVAAGEAIAAQIPLPDTLPQMMRLMPQVRNLPFTLRYYHQNLLGHAELGEGFVDTYLENNEKLTMALLRAQDGAAAATLYRTVVDLIGAGVPTTPVSDLGREAVSFSSAQYGLCYVMYEGRYVAMTLGVHDHPTAEGLLRITGTSIRISQF